MNPTSPRILLLPDWQNSGPQHWLSHWEQRYGYTRVQQHDWQRPLRGDWSIQLQEAVLASDAPVVLVAHGLGCILTAWWAAHSPLAHTRVQAALLVEPCDPAQDHLRTALPGWLPVATARLPFPSVLLGRHDHACCSLECAQHMAQNWGAEFIDLGLAGHIHSSSGLSDWEAGHAILQRLINA